MKQGFLYLKTDSFVTASAVIPDSGAVPYQPFCLPDTSDWSAAPSDQRYGALRLRK